MKILVVEDDQALLELFREILSQAGHTVGLAESGTGGLRRFREENWDVVLTNRVRDGMNGDQFAETIKKTSPTTLVLMLTSFPPAAPDPNVDAVLLKPFSGEDLLAAIARCLAAATPFLTEAKTLQFRVQPVLLQQKPQFQVRVGLDGERNHDFIPVHRSAFAGKIPLKEAHDTQDEANAERNALIEWLEMTRKAHSVKKPAEPPLESEPPAESTQPFASFDEPTASRASL